MSVKKYIYWHDDKPASPGMCQASVHYLVGYTLDRSVVTFLDMVSELRKTFPQARWKDIECGKVYHSSYVKGYTIIAWDHEIPKKSYPGWYEVDSEGRAAIWDYSW